ncbi:MAG: hypothetical protein NTX25_02180 [Proteobacteria bacterium]|nr:hypothetical protein [Pseudomonadota bacterium]
MKVLAFSLVLLGILNACKTVDQGAASQVMNKKQDRLDCGGDEIQICVLPDQYPLDVAIDRVLEPVQESVKKHGLDKNNLDHAIVACAEVSYPGSEAAIINEAKKRGTFICLFNSAFVMNMSLNRLSTFIEDFETVDQKSDYSDKQWVKAQIDDGTQGHNLESQDLQRYLKETKKYIDKRAKSEVKGIKLETEFLENYIRPAIDEVRGKPKSILLGVFLPEEGKKKDASAQLKAVLGHEIFHSLYFHCDKMQKQVKGYIDGTQPEEVRLMKKKLSQKGYAVENSDGKAPSEKQIYMFYNEAQAYLLESGACRDGAFVEYEDGDKESPEKPIENKSPLIVKHTGKLRQVLLKENVISADWAQKWSPDLTAMGCKP